MSLQGRLIPLLIINFILLPQKQTTSITIKKKKANYSIIQFNWANLQGYLPGGKKVQTNTGIKIPSPFMNKGIPDLSEILLLTDSTTSKLVT